MEWKNQKGKKKQKWNVKQKFNKHKRRTQTNTQDIKVRFYPPFSWYIWLLDSLIDLPQSYIYYIFLCYVHWSRTIRINVSLCINTHFLSQCLLYFHLLMNACRNDLRCTMQHHQTYNSSSHSENGGDFSEKLKKYVLCILFDF